MSGEIIKKRFLELAQRAYDKQIYTFTDFLSMDEISAFYAVWKQIAHVPYTLFGGMEGCERQIIRFGSAELCGYEAELPIRCLSVRPLSAKFSEKLTHRDFLGALMSLGIDRSAIGDIIVSESGAHIFCMENMAEYIANSFTQVRRTSVACELAESLPKAASSLREVTVQVSSERLDAVIARVLHMSRGDSAGLFAAERVYVNSALCVNSSRRPIEGDIISVRGIGRFLYRGVLGTTKKGRLNVSAAIYE